MKTKLKLLAALLAAAFVTDCAHKIEDNLNKKLAEQPDISGPQSLADQASKLIQTSPNLTELQRSKLSKLRDETQQKIKDIDQLSLKLRSTLYADLVSPSFNRKEVDLIKNRIKKVEKKKVSVSAKCSGIRQRYPGPRGTGKRKTLGRFLLQSKSRSGLYDEKLIRS